MLYAVYGRYFSVVQGVPGNAPRVGKAAGGLLAVAAAGSWVAAYFVGRALLPWSEESLAPAFDSIPAVGGFLGGVAVVLVGFSIAGAIAAAGVGAMVVGVRSLRSPTA